MGQCTVEKRAVQGTEGLYGHRVKPRGCGPPGREEYLDLEKTKTMEEEPG